MARGYKPKKSVYAAAGIRAGLFMRSESQRIISLFFKSTGNLPRWTPKTKSSSSSLFKGRGKTEKMINDNATSNRVKLKTKIAVEKYLKAPMWKTTKLKALFNGQNAPSWFEAIQPPLCVSPKIIETKPKTATPIKLIIKNVINADFM